MAGSPRAGANIAMPTSTNKADWERTYHTWLTGANRGSIKCTGTVTLAANANTTTVQDSRAGPTSFIGLMPKTASAAVEYKNLAVQAQGNGIFAISHSNNAIADREFAYCIMG